MKKSRPDPAYSALIGRRWQVTLPKGVSDVRIGQRLYWHVDATRVIASLKPGKFRAPRYVTTRVKRGVAVRRPAWRLTSPAMLGRRSHNRKQRAVT